MKTVLVALLIIGFLVFPSKARAQEYIEDIPRQSFYQGIVSNVLSETDLEVENRFTQVLEVRILTGDKKGETITIERGQVEYVFKEELYAVGDQIIVSSLELPESGPSYNIADRYRVPALAWLAVLYAVAITIIGRMKGIRSLIGMGLSFVVLIQFIIPAILSGKDPVVVSLVGALGIETISLYITHGLTKKTHISLVSTVLTLGFTGLLAVLATKAAALTGFGSEEAVFLQSSPMRIASMKGLLLGGMLIGALGVIDDVTVSQTTAVFELFRANKKLSVKELYKRGLEVGKDHIASLTNTLVLAYAGASLPLFLLFYQNDLVPPWVALNSEPIAQEIVATLVGSLGLVVSVPITTFLAATYAKKAKDLPASSHPHAH